MAKKRVLCRIKMSYNYTNMVIYRDGTWRWADTKDLMYWKLAYSDVGHLFLYKEYEKSAWQTDWDSSDEDEVRIANTIAEALSSLEIENLLKSK